MARALLPLLAFMGPAATTPHGHGRLPTRPSAADRALAARWARTLQGGSVGALPFSFRYGGRPSAELLAAWPSTRRCEAAPASQSLPSSSPRAERCTTTWRDGNGVDPLVVRYRLTTFEPAGEAALWWVLHFTNNGSVPSHILTDVRAADWAVEDTATAGAGGAGENVSLHWTDFGSFGPAQASLGRGATGTLPPELGQPGDATPTPPGPAMCSGKSSGCGAAPFFRLEWPSGGAATVAVGWTGTWQANLTRSRNSSAVHLSAGMASSYTHWKSCDPPAPPPPAEWVKQCLRDSSLLPNHTIYANDYASFELPSSDTTPCAQACCEDSRCFGWSVDDPIP